MKQVPAIIGWILLILAFGLFIYGVFYAIFIPDTSSNGILIVPEPLDTLTATIGAILLTNLGAVLGISVNDPNSALAGKTLIANQTQVPPPLNKRELIQFTAVIIYLIALVACFITWASNKFSSDPKLLVPFVIGQGKTLIGVITAYIAFVLGVNQT